MTTSPLLHVGRRDLLAVEEAVVLVADVARLVAEGDLLGQAGAQRVGAGDDDAVVDAQLEEGVAARRGSSRGSPRAAR